jgi:hypothetical protein
MAERNIVAGLFGMTPEMYQSQQYQQDLKRGYELAQLTPGAAAQASLMASVGQLGRGIGGAMGIEDPQLKLISARNTIAQQIDQTSPESILKGAQMLSQMGDQQGAMALAQYARQAQVQIAEQQQRLAAGKASLASAARERLQGVDKDIQIANELSTIQDTLDQLKAQPASPERDRAMNLLTTRYTELQRLTSKGDKDKPIASGTDRDAYSREMYDNKIYVDLTPVQKAAVNKRIQDEEGTKAEKGASKTILPGQPVPTKDWMDFTQKVLSGDPVMQRTSTILSDAPSAIEIIRNSTSNDFAAASLPTSIALLTGQGKNMSNADVNRFARTGGLDDRLAQDAVKFFTGGTTQVKKDQAEKFAVALYRGALLERKKKLESAAEEFGYTESPNYKVALRNIDSQLAQFKLVKKGEKAPAATKTGNPLVDKWLSTDAEK